MAAPLDEVILGLRCNCGGYFRPAHAEDRELIENTTEREA